MSTTKGIVLITGANRGIGLGLVIGFLQDGYKVIATSRHPALAQDLQTLKQHYPETLIIEQIDVTKAADFQQISTKYAQITIDILINNAGVFPENHSRAGISEADPKHVLAAFETNALGALMAIQHFQSHLLKSQYPRVINISSQMGLLSSAKGFCYSYRMSKVALNMLTKCFANENSQIITIALRPGWVKTAMGGSNASLSIEESVKKMMEVITNLTSKDSGQFFDIEKNPDSF